jgi:uncharacterized protein YrzB (UPF0473 family)
MENEEGIIELVDEEGGKERFIFLTTLEHDGRQFAVLTPEDSSGGEKDEEPIVILELLDSDNGEDMDLVTIDDDELAEAVFNEYLEMIEEEDGEEDGGEDEEK